MTDLSKLQEWVADFNNDALLAKGFEEAVMGVAERCGQPTLVVYDIEKCLEILINRDGMDRTEAQEYLNFNVLGAWMGEHTPLFFTPIDL